MANFNEKVLCLFKKNTQQIEKEAQRRGISTYTPVNGCKSREHMIAEIIYKDAYDCGRGNPVDTTCPANCRGKAKPETAEYELFDRCENTRYHLELTEDQVRLMHWLDNKGMLCESEFTEWGEMFVDVGEI